MESVCRSDYTNGEEGNNPIVTVTDVFKLLQTLRSSKKICSISFFLDGDGSRGFRGGVCRWWWWMRNEEVVV